MGENIKADDKWDKPIVVAKSIDNYYRKISDKRIFQYANVILVEEENEYILIKNLWKYDTDFTKCRNLLGREFNVRDIEFIKIRQGDYHDVVNIEEELPKHIIIKNFWKF